MNSNKQDLNEGEGISTDASRTDADKPSRSKRALFQAAWVAPVIVVATLPRSGYAANISGGHGRSYDHRGDHDRGGDTKGDHGNHFGQIKNKP